MNNAKMCNYILHGSVWKMSMSQATGSKNAMSENGFESGDAHPAYASQCAVHAAWCCATCNACFKAKVLSAQVPGLLTEQ